MCNISSDTMFDCYRNYEKKCKKNRYKSYGSNVMTVRCSSVAKKATRAATQPASPCKIVTLPVKPVDKMQSVSNGAVAETSPHTPQTPSNCGQPHITVTRPRKSQAGSGVRTPLADLQAQAVPVVRALQFKEEAQSTTEVNVNHSVTVTPGKEIIKP